MGAGRRRSRPAASLGLAAALVLCGCEREWPTAPTPVVVADPHPERVEFTGLIQEPYPYWETMRPVAGVRVTLQGGQVQGRTAVTDAQGRFAFLDYPTCARGSMECRVRSIWIEKPGYETRWESLDDDYIETTPGFFTTEYRWRADYRELTIGHAWPPDPQFDRLRREVPAVEPLWLVLWKQERWPWGGNEGGGYGGHIMYVLAPSSKPAWVIGRALTHEYCHAHQDWVTYPLDRTFHHWPDTPEGRAFIAAEAADRTEGKYLSRRESYVERAADACAYFYYEVVRSPPWELKQDRAWLRETVPHQYEWASKWLQGFGGFREPATLRFRRGGG